ncbi:ferredoxin reductase [Streptomyces aureoverticillatus]|uniref:ferredoxin reductase n=1 Tax=Streptomyces aureoverticillatus TaxID=66871 RepID=UPI0013DD2FB3|nr:ferredoxin reductase [Streptomyces aureoverticillatus]QIB47164.1 ferredoxin reductase [Streptomyces aureoverticillatus]
MPVFAPRPQSPPWGLPGRFGTRLLSALSTLTTPLTTPLTPDDFLGLVDPLLSARHPAGVVTAVRPETADAATLVIRPGRGWCGGHRAGQYLPVGVELDGVRHWRTYSLTSAAGAPDRELTITVKADPRGKVSPHLVHRTPPGTILRLGPAQGEFVFPEPEATPDRLLFVTAGSGITPVMGMLRTLILRRDRPAPDVVLLHSAPAPDECLFRAELTLMAGQLTWLRLHLRYTRTAARITARDIALLCPDWRSRETWACGPEGLLAVLREHWEAERRGGERPDGQRSDGQRPGGTEGPRAGSLHVERFHLTAPTAAPLTPADDSGGRVRFARTGVEVASPASVPLLVTGERAGVPMPYGCRRGICFGCLVPLLHGRVRDLRTGEVHDAQGELIQTCVQAAVGTLVLDR